MSVLPSVPMVYSGMLIEGGVGCETFLSLAVDRCVLNTGFIVGKSVTFGHGIAIDSAQGVFLLYVAFTLRRASNVALFSSVMLCVDVCRLTLSSCLSFVDKFFLLALCCAFLSSKALFCRAALLRALISSFCLSVKLLC